MDVLQSNIEAVQEIPKKKESSLPQKTNFIIKKYTEKEIGLEDSYSKEGYIKGILPCGIIIDGKVCKTFELEELDGTGEEFMTSERIRGQNFTKGITYALTHHLKKLGHLDDENINDSILRQMYAGDRDYLYYKLRIMAEGYDFKTNFTCESCNAITSVDVDIRDFLVTVIEDLKENPIIVGEFRKPVKDKMGKVYKTYTLRPLTGLDQEAMDGIEEYSQLISVTLSRVLLKLDDTQIKYTPDFIKNLPFSARKQMRKDLDDKCPGIDFKIFAKCSKCNQINLNRVGLKDFLF